MASHNSHMCIPRYPDARLLRSARLRAGRQDALFAGGGAYLARGFPRLGNIRGRQHPDPLTAAVRTN